MEYESIKGKTFASKRERYDWYIGHSIEWQEARAKRLDEDGHQCQMCSTCGCGRNPLQVHHTSYDEYNEIGYDVHTGHLITLCSMCHHDVHAFEKDIAACVDFKSRLLTTSSYDINNSGLSNVAMRAFLEASCNAGVLKQLLIAETISTIIDAYFTRRCKELSPGGDINFFTGHPANQQTVHPYINGLFDLSPYADIRAICIQNAVRVGQFNYGRYNNIRCMISDPKAPKKSRLAAEGCGYHDSSRDEHADAHTEHPRGSELAGVLERLQSAGSMDIVKS